MSFNYDILRTLSLVDEINQAITLQKKREVDFTFNLLDELKLFSKNNQHLLPYRLNIIDELHINENGHSRILCKLLRYQSHDGKYIFLESFVKYIISLEHKPLFERIVISEPIITQEECRIDLWIRDFKGNYAIIFENKIYNATDQEAQLSRYIDCTKANGFAKENIFVVYLSRSGENPADQSWGKYKQDFESKYVNLSFRNEILPWLKTFVLDLVSENDNLLKSAIEQYIDYLEGIFNLRLINNEFYMKINDMIREKINLSGNSEQDLKPLREKYDDLNQLQSYLFNMLTDIHNECWRLWQSRLSNKYGMNEEVEVICNQNGKYPYIGVTVKILEKKILVIIEKNRDNLIIYYGIRSHLNDNNVDELIKERLTPALSYLNGESDQVWYQWKYSELETTYQDLEDLIDEVLKLL